MKNGEREWPISLLSSVYFHTKIILYAKSLVVQTTKYSEKSIPCGVPAFSNHGRLYHAWNTTAYYSYYFDYLLSLPFKESCRTLGIYFR